MPTIEEIQTQVHDLRARPSTSSIGRRPPSSSTSARPPSAVADRLPEDRPELLVSGLDTVDRQIDFAKQVLDAAGRLRQGRPSTPPCKPLRPGQAAKAAVKAA